MAQVIVSLFARSDEAYVIRDLAKEAGRRVAVKYSERFQTVYTRLGGYPEMGALRLSLGENVRMIVVSPYIVLYSYDPRTDAVTILRIVHGRRKIAAALLASDLDP